MSYITKTSSTELQDAEESFYLEIPTTIKKAMQTPIVKAVVYTGVFVVSVYGLIYALRLTTKVVSAGKALQKEIGS